MKKVPESPKLPTVASVLEEIKENSTFPPQNTELKNHPSSKETLLSIELDMTSKLNTKKCKTTIKHTTR